VDYGNPTSYLSLEPGTDVISSDGKRLGKVEHVLAAEDEDIFDGLVVDVQAGPGGLRFVDADQVDELYENAAVLKLSEAEADQLPKPEPAPAVMDSEADAPGPLESKLRRAWDLISGNY
jgi:sporulation protein YlmC with PRC-barrel domain